MNRISKALTSILTPIVMLLFLNEPLYSQKPEITPDVQFIYVKAGGNDVYREGQRTGKAIYVLFSGEFKLYGLYHKSEPVLEKTGHLEEDQLDSLKYYLRTTDFFNFPNYLPKTKRIFWPITSCSIGYRESETDSMKIVNVILHQSKKYYPKDFFKLQSKIEEILFNKKE